MKLLKGILTIALISVIAVSCKDAKKDVDAVKDGVEVVTGDAKDASADTVVHKCDASCKENGCSHGKKDGQKCDENCKKKCCTAKMKGECKAADMKCGEADCKGEGCLKCVAKKAECKAKCAAKKAAGDVKGAVKDGADALKKVVQ
ncbi:MAG: hypothetical protein L3J14_08340 [Flavobacteriaceae bacterium]|nr:hypothetical protein [Flavobacteriaceae bacterium]